MQRPNEENIDELFARFLEPDRAADAVEDIRNAENILAENPAPQPSEELIDDIKAKVAQALHRKKTTDFRQAVYKTAAVAAIFIFAAVISVKLFDQDSDGPKRFTASIIPTAIWESDEDTDPDFAELTAEIEQVQSEISALQLNEDDGNGSETVTEIETELIEINTNFWKG